MYSAYSAVKIPLLLGRQLEFTSVLRKKSAIIGATRGCRVQPVRAGRVGHHPPLLASRGQSRDAPQSRIHRVQQGDKGGVSRTGGLNLLGSPMQPARNIIMAHNVVSRQSFAVVDENDSPLEPDPDFIGTPGKFSQSETAVSVGIPEGRGNRRDCLFRFCLHIRPKPFSGFPYARSKKDANHSLPVNGTNLPAFRTTSISAIASVSAASAWCRGTPYSSKAGNSLGRNGNPPTFTI